MMKGKLGDLWIYVFTGACGESISKMEDGPAMRLRSRIAKTILEPQIILCWSHFSVETLLELTWRY